MVCSSVSARSVPNLRTVSFPQVVFLSFDSQSSRYCSCHPIYPFCRSSLSHVVRSSLTARSVPHPHASFISRVIFCQISFPISPLPQYSPPQLLVPLLGLPLPPVSRVLYTQHVQGLHPLTSFISQVILCQFFIPQFLHLPSNYHHHPYIHYLHFLWLSFRGFPTLSTLHPCIPALVHKDIRIFGTKSPQETDSYIARQLIM